MVAAGVGTNGIRNEIPGTAIDEIARVDRFADRSMIAVDTHRVDMQQARIAAIGRDDDARGGSLLFVEDLVADSPRPVAVPDIEIAQIGIVLDKVEGRCGRPCDQSQLVEQLGVHRAECGVAINTMPLTCSTKARASAS